jgi:hypothetical protein
MRVLHMMCLVALGAVTACGAATDGTSPVKTVPQVIATITVNHAGDSLDIGNTLQLTAVVRDSQGVVIPGVAVNWTTPDHSVFDVSTSGLVTGLMPGATTVAASIGPIAASVPLRVRVATAARYALDSMGQILDATSVGQTPASDFGTSDVSAIELPDGRIRVYFTTANGPNTFGQGAPTLTGDANHPTAFVNADGSVSLIYYQRREHLITVREMIATSKDGLTFDTEYDLGFPGTEPSFVRRRDGSMLVYYGAGSVTTGSSISVARLTPIVR